MVFKDPWVLFLIPFVTAAVFLLGRRQKQSALNFSSSQLLKSLTNSWKVKFSPGLFYLRLLTIILFLVALAGPRSVLKETLTKTEGIDIILAIDVSGSMAAEDFEIQGQRMNRLAIIKRVVEEFIEQRPHDRIGLIAFGSFAYTVCPLTSDHDWLKQNLERIELGIIEDSTAIGSGIASSVARLKNSDAKSKVVVLLTDGINNAGKIDPLSAARMAQAFGIKVYTIGAGTKGYAPFPATDVFGRKVYQRVLIEIDEDTLKEIAKITNAKYFRATDTESLRQIYKEIDQMEKVKIEEHGYLEYTELFYKFLLLAFVLLAVELILSNTIFLRIP